MYPVGPPHAFTLLDGEMVVDELGKTGGRQRRRYLAYDLMVLNHMGVSDLRFQVGPTCHHHKEKGEKCDVCE